MAIWDLEDLDSAAMLEKAMLKGTEAIDELRMASWRARIIRKSLLPTLQLLDQTVPMAADQEALTVVVPGGKDTRSRPSRYVNALNAIQTLYTVCARIHSQDPDTLFVASCDSGSDFSFAVVGLVLVVRALDKLLVHIYQTWAFHKQAAQAANIDNVADKLAIFQEIHDLEKNSKIGREDAGHLKHELKGAVSMAIEAGLVTPNILKQSHGQALELMAPAPKLLLGPAQAVASVSEAQQEPSTPEIASLTPEERRLLENLLRKVKSHPEEESLPTQPPSSCLDNNSTEGPPKAKPDGDESASDHPGESH
jgi:hypothetical protein